MNKPKVQQQWKNEIKADYSELSNEEKHSFTRLLDEYAELFDDKEHRFGRTHLVEQPIETGSAHPIKQAPRRLPPNKRDVVDNQLSELMEHNRIEPSNSPWSSPLYRLSKAQCYHRERCSTIAKIRRYSGVF